MALPTNGTDNTIELGLDIIVKNRARYYTVVE